jgi:phage head maturation protease
MATLIQGFVHVWRSRGVDDFHADRVFAPHAFSNWCRTNGQAMPLLYQHEELLKLASRGRAGTLTLWSCEYGLAFEAEIPHNAFMMVVHDIAQGRMGCSMQYKVFHSERGFLAGRPPADTPMSQLLEMPMGEVVTRASLHEITLTPSPAYDQGRVWFRDADPRELTDEQAHQRRIWRAAAERIESGAADMWPQSYDERRERAQAKAKQGNVVQLPRALNNLRDARQSQERRAPHAAYAMPHGEDAETMRLYIDAGWSAADAALIVNNGRQTREFMARGWRAERQTSRGKRK